MQFNGEKKCDKHQQHIEFVGLNENTKKAEFYCSQCEKIGTIKITEAFRFMKEQLDKYEKVLKLQENFDICYSILNKQLISEYIDSFRDYIKERIDSICAGINLIKNITIAMQNGLEDYNDSYQIDPNIVNSFSIVLNTYSIISNNQLKPNVNCFNVDKQEVQKVGECLDILKKFFKKVEYITDMPSPVTFPDFAKWEDGKVLKQTSNKKQFIQILEQEILITHNVEAMSLNSSNQLIAIGSNCNLNQQIDNSISIWKLDNYEITLLSRLNGHQKNVKCITFSNCDNSIMSGGYDNQIIYWVQSTKSQWIIGQRLLGHSQTVNCLCYNNIEQLLISGGDNVIIWKGEQQWKIGQEFTIENESITALYLNEDCKQFMVGSNRGTILIFQLGENNYFYQKCSLNAIDQPILNICQLDEHNFILIQNYSIWEFTEIDELYEYVQRELEEIKSAHISKQYNFAVLANNSEATLYSIQKQEILQTFHQSVQCMALSKDGSKLVLISKGKLHILEIRNEGY